MTKGVGMSNRAHRISTYLTRGIAAVGAGVLIGLVYEGGSLDMRPAPEPVPHTAPSLTLEDHAAGWVNPDAWASDAIPARALTDSRKVMPWDTAWNLNNNANPTDDVFVIGVK